MLTGGELTEGAITRAFMPMAAEPRPRRHGRAPEIGAGQDMGKVFGRFDPTPSRTPEECECHYTEVHVRMAQDLLRPMPALT